jgi:Fuc2NAc and GlcNAc transferase
VSELIAPLAAVGFAPILAAVAAFLLGCLLIRHASALGLQDLPNARSSHVVPRPRGGGAGIVVAFLVALPLGLPAGTFSTWPVWIPLAAAVMLAVVGLLDDLKGLGLAARLVSQALAVAALLATLAWSAGGTGESDLGLLGTVSGVPSLVLLLSTQAPPWLMAALDLLLVPVLVTGALWWINLFNFMDGIDGLAASQALFMLAASLAIKLTDAGSGAESIAFISAPAPAACLILAAAIGGFLLLNLPPARLFMGDSGSLFLGFSILGLAAHDVTYGDMSLWTWLILGGMFWVDATVTLSRRWLTGQPVTAAHRSHLYQRLSRRWAGHSRVTLVYFLLNVAWFLPLAFLAHRAPLWAPMIVVVACLPVAAVAWRAGAGLPQT